MAELNTAGIAAVLTADAQTQVGVGLAAVMGSHLDQLANADLIQVLERIALVDLVLVVCAQELGGIITAEACLLYTSPSPRDRTRSRMPSSA